VPAGDLPRHHSALHGVAAAIAAAGDPDRAEALARTISDLSGGL
jgi:hypothetical protein